MQQSARRAHPSTLRVVPYTDPVFFHKSQVKVGATFEYFGRTNPNTHWVVYSIWTPSSRQENAHSYVADVRTLKDKVRLRCEETGDTIELRFGYLSYSAIWRLEKQ